MSWIIQIKTIFSITFFLVALLSFLSWEKHKKEIIYWVSFLFFSLSLLVKSSFGPLVLAMPFYKKKLRMIPFITICLYSIILTLWSSHLKDRVTSVGLPSFIISSANAQVTAPSAIGNKEESEFVKLSNKLNLGINNLVKYSFYIIFPWDNLLVHPKTLVDYSFKYFLYAVIFFGLLSLLILYEWKKREDKWLVVGVLFYFLTLLPFSGIVYVPIFHFSNFVEYWLSVPFLGVILMVSRLPSRFYAQIILCIFGVMLFSRTMYSSQKTSSPVEIIEQSIRVNPDSDLVRMILAKHYFFEREYVKSNGVLLKVKRNHKLDAMKIDEDIEINMKAMRGEKVNEYTL